MGKDKQTEFSMLLVAFWGPALLLGVSDVAGVTGFYWAAGLASVVTFGYLLAEIRS